MKREEAIAYWKQRSEVLHNWLKENEYEGFLVEYVEAVDMAIEALQADVVRCKDCRHRYEEGDCTHYYWCRINDRPVDDADYCAWGEESEVEE